MASGASTTSWVGDFDRLIACLDDRPLGEVQRLCDLGRGKFDAVEARRLAAEIGVDGDDARARRMAAGNGRRSKRAARDAAKRAAAAARNKQLVDDLESGDLSSEQFDAIADAAATDESAATDQDFIDKIKKHNADQARKLAAVRKHKQQRSESEHAKQRRLRRVSKYKDFATGLSTLSMAGDDATIEELWTLITAREKRLKIDDGGRGLPARHHPRTFDQRLFDALADLVRSTPAAGLGAKPSIVIQISAETGQAAIVGGGPVPDEYVREVLGRSNLSVEIVDSLSGQPLFHGRVRRDASAAQWVALIGRDHGCVLCGAHWMRCEAHHLMPWTAAGQGETNIDDLALVCVEDHHNLHTSHLTLERVDGVWATRPALHHEIASQRRASTQTDAKPHVQPEPVVPINRNDRDPARLFRPPGTTPNAGSSDDGEDAPGAEPAA